MSDSQYSIQVLNILTWKNRYHYAQCYQYPCKPLCRSNCRHNFSHDVFFVHLCCDIKYGLLLGWVTFQTWPLTTLDMLVLITIPFWSSDAKSFLMLLGKQQVPGPWWMALHTDCATNMIFRLWWQNLSICIMFGMNPSWNRISHAQSKTVQYYNPVPLMIDDITIYWSLKPLSCYLQNVMLLHVYNTKLDYFNKDFF